MAKDEETAQPLDEEQKKKLKETLQRSFDSMSPEEKKAFGEEAAAILRSTILPQVIENAKRIKKILESDKEAALETLKKMKR